MAMLGAGISPGGESKHQQQAYQKQVAAAVAALLGLQFTPKHKVAEPIDMIPAEITEEKNTEAVVVSVK